MGQIHRVCMGGTFDILHKGHRALLTKASEIGNIVLIGLTTDIRARKGRTEVEINSYETRKENLEILLDSMNLPSNFQIVPLDNDWGPSVIEESFTAIIVSEETKKTAEKINKIRNKDGKDKLEIIMVPFVKAYDGQRISSSRIRNNEIDSNGMLA
ncbi:MAG: pantetheine-phosphate adenylyltransferase [Candidatus Poseidoniia archaeon]|nr:pantetheine-phosphate adenylyltransferase [Candidatus Poseidoniia archaeon]